LFLFVSLAAFGAQAFKLNAQLSQQLGHNVLRLTRATIEMLLLQEIPLGILWLEAMEEMQAML
jgi:hypothetical protein